MYRNDEGFISALVGKIVTDLNLLLRIGGIGIERYLNRNIGWSIGLGSMRLRLR